MFRPMRRKSRAISDEAARRLLETERRGVLAVAGDDGYPFAFPINFFFDAEAGKIYFHGAKKGHKVDSLRRCDKVCFTVMGNERVVQGEEWAPFVQSAVAFGRCKLIEDADAAMAAMRRLALRYYPSAEEIDAEIAQSMPAVQLFEIDIEHLTGKEIQEK